MYCFQCILTGIVPALKLKYQGQKLRVLCYNLDDLMNAPKMCPSRLVPHERRPYSCRMASSEQYSWVKKKVKIETGLVPCSHKNKTPRNGDPKWTRLPCRIKAAHPRPPNQEPSKRNQVGQTKKEKILYRP